jgi:hypothetical protein
MTGGGEIGSRSDMVADWRNWLWFMAVAWIVFVRCSILAASSLRPRARRAEAWLVSVGTMIGLSGPYCFFQDGEEMTLAGHDFAWLTQLIINAAQHCQVRQRFGAISAIERLINFDSAEHERFRFNKIVF